MDGYDSHQGWINCLAVHPDFQRNGIAAALIQQLKKRLQHEAAQYFNDSFVKTITMYRILMNNWAMKKST
jgi:ribosomal protein S18 acetylase RimI-like enzyme